MTPTYNKDWLDEYKFRRTKQLDISSLFSGFDVPDYDKQTKIIEDLKKKEL